MNLWHEIRRKLVHLSSLWMVLAIYMLDSSTAICVFGGLFALFAVGEYLRMTHRPVEALITRYLGAIMRHHEKSDGFSFKALTGSFYFLLAVFLSVILFAKPIAMAAVTVMILSDTLAALVGKSIGKIRIWDKTLEGSLAFWLTSFVVLYGMVDGLVLFQYGIIAAIVTLVELVSNKIHVDDNLSITLLTGFLLTSQMP